MKSVQGRMWGAIILAIGSVLFSSCDMGQPRCGTQFPDGGPTGFTLDCGLVDAGTQTDAGVCDGGTSDGGC